MRQSRWENKRRESLAAVNLRSRHISKDAKIELVSESKYETFKLPHEDTWWRSCKVPESRGGVNTKSHGR